MTAVDVSYRYGQPPTPTVLRALDSVRDVYGVRRIRFVEAERIVRVEYDATRLNENTVAALLRSAGLDVRDKLVHV